MSPYRLEAPELAWWMTQVEERGPVVALNGVIRPPVWPSEGDYKLAVDGKISTAIDYLRQPDAGAINFRAMLPVASSFGQADEIDLRVMDATTSRFVRDWDQYRLAKPGKKSPIPNPPAKLTQRAIWLSPMTFDKEGYALKRKYEEAAHSLFPKRDGKLRLLDWGCGAGRMAKYLAGKFDYTGIDIDREAIEWCRASIPDARFEMQGLSARTEFADNSFDAIIGISIFTHLREEEQFAWLAELSRIGAPDGLVAVSVNGATSLFNAGNPPDVIETLTRNGFCDTGAEHSHRGVTSDDSYYRNTYHTHGYIRERWSEYFEVMQILPAFVGNMQDMVFLRPRKDRA